MIRTCKHCKKRFDISDKPKGWMANHSRWCDLNPKREQYNKDTAHMRAGITEESRKKQREGVKRAHQNGKYDHIKGTVNRHWLGRKHTEETKKLISEKARQSKHRRLKKGVVEYKGILLDSSWELALAKRLDELNVSWIRPEPIEWVDSKGLKRNYFPDFYLPEYEIYLDPKNPHAIKVQKKKIDALLEQHSNIIILDSLDKCSTYRPFS
jgi:hypothetical protein